MKLNDREKKLIFIVVGVILIALSYFIGYRKISAANNKLDDKIEENRTLYNNLKEMQENLTVQSKKCEKRGRRKTRKRD